MATRHDIVDVLIIGSGASGAAVAYSLAETKMRILCLEQGDWIKPTDFPSNGRDWEARRHADFDMSPNRRGRVTDYPVNDDASLMKVANFNAVGGGTVMYTAHWPRLHPSDFRVRTLDGVADDWPIDYWALEPFFEENDRMMGISGLAGDPGEPLHQPPMPPVPLGRTGMRYAKAMNRLGWHWWPSDVSVATTEYEGRAKCINLGHCTPGCAQGAKASTDITYWPAAIRAGVELRPRCRVREVTVNAEGMASGAIYYDADGAEHLQPAEMVIVACNGVGTPRLLLNSVSGRFPDGLANSSGLVGRNLMMHPWPQVSGFIEDRVDGGRGPMTSLWSKQFYETDPSRDFVRGYMMQFNRGTGPVQEAILSIESGRLPWGKDHHRIYRTRLDHRLQIGIACDDLPEAHNRVTLDPVLKDSNGIPGARIDYTISENTRRMMEHGIARATEVLEAAGAKDIFCSRTVLNSPGHLLGTCRMGNDPERSVVNAWGRSHDVRNLFIVDGSVWVTGGGVNPTSTIQAVALYIADQIKQRLATLFE
ncbi:MAG TPA: GMC family oxidoreductase [Rhodopila sp.]|uniref:GMC family oxidoreductase n=1 Tax=Rhodopila sp. TaxID=2480087 RepID=UPI002CB69DD4|nr:GMC family oxidoreductase [Rhodopila sp.]HVY17250.1 GMC family oxidoreductase [Rhodopila sp.]